MRAQSLSRPAVPLLIALTGCFHDPHSTGSSATESVTSAASATETSEPTTESGSENTTEPSVTVTGSSSTTLEPTTDSDPSTTSTTTGSSTTSRGFCGDGLLDADEECDLGPNNADEGACTSTCTLAVCGDGFIQPSNDEACDDGPSNSNKAACTEACVEAFCGDGFVWQDVEECDDGPDNEAGVYDGCTPMTCTLGPHCGDSEVQKDHEECDLGEELNGLDGGACDASCGFNGKVVFATSKLYPGALGGIDGADDKCNTLAMQATLANAGFFMTWLSTGDTSPAARMTPHDEPLVLTDGSTVVAESWADLTDGSLAAKILADETGAALDGSDRAWTGTTASGEPSMPTCEDWTSDSKSHFGLQGSLAAINEEWSSATIKGCQYSARLICVEQ